MSGHTPGPWDWATSLDIGGETEFDSLYQVSTGEQVLGPTWTDNPIAVGQDDARLIAAAPDLLEAAKWSLAHDPGQNVLRKAVEKAEGKT
jgi:hypothetical protein